MYLELEENAKIVMKWRMKDWASKEGTEPDSMELDVNDSGNVFSNVTLEFIQTSDSSVEIKLSQTDIPEYDRFSKFVHLSNLEQGWRQMIFGRIEQVFGYPMKK